MSLLQFRDILQRKISLDFKLACGSPIFAREILASKVKLVILWSVIFGVLFASLNFVLVFFKRRQKVYRLRIDQDFEKPNVMMDDLDLDNIHLN